MSGARGTDVRVVALLVLLIAAAGLLGARSGRVDGAHAAFTDAVTTSSSTLGAGTVPPLVTLGCGGTLGAATLNWTAVTGATGYRILRPNGTTVTVGTVTTYAVGTISVASAYTVTPLVGTWAGTGASVTLVISLGSLACL